MEADRQPGKGWIRVSPQSEKDFAGGPADNFFWKPYSISEAHRGLARWLFSSAASQVGVLYRPHTLFLWAFYEQNQFIYFQFEELKLYYEENFDLRGHVSHL